MLVAWRGKKNRKRRKTQCGQRHNNQERPPKRSPPRRRRSPNQTSPTCPRQVRTRCSGSRTKKEQRSRKKTQNETHQNASFAFYGIYCLLWTMELTITGRHLGPGRSVDAASGAIAAKETYGARAKAQRPAAHRSKRRAEMVVRYWHPARCPSMEHIRSRGRIIVISRDLSLRARGGRHRNPTAARHRLAQTARCVDSCTGRVSSKFVYSRLISRAFTATFILDSTWITRLRRHGHCGNAW